MKEGEQVWLCLVPLATNLGLYASISNLKVTLEYNYILNQYQSYIIFGALIILFKAFERYGSISNTSLELTKIDSHALAVGDVMYVSIYEL